MDAQRRTLEECESLLLFAMTSCRQPFLTWTLAQGWTIFAFASSSTSQSQSSRASTGLGHTLKKRTGSMKISYGPWIPRFRK